MLEVTQLAIIGQTAVAAVVPRLGLFSKQMTVKILVLEPLVCEMLSSFSPLWQPDCATQFYHKLDVSLFSRQAA